METQAYKREDGSSPYQDWFDSLDRIAAAKVASVVLRLEHGNKSNLKRIGEISERKINWGPGYRIYLAQEGKQLIILLGGGTKATQQSDIDRAKSLYREYRERKKLEKKKGKG
jgi:putative addiction module killer protein